MRALVLISLLSLGCASSTCPTGDPCTGPETTALRSTAIDTSARLACGDLETSCFLVDDNAPAEWAMCFDKAATATDCAELRSWVRLCLGQPQP